MWPTVRRIGWDSLNATVWCSLFLIVPLRITLYLRSQDVAFWIQLASLVFSMMMVGLLISLTISVWIEKNYSRWEEEEKRAKEGMKDGLLKQYRHLVVYAIWAVFWPIACFINLNSFYISLYPDRYFFIPYVF